MRLTDTFIRKAKSTSAAGDKRAGGDGLYLLVKDSGKYRRMDYRFLGQRKTLALGVYPAVSLASARKRRDEARTLLAEGIDPSQAKQEGKYARTRSSTSLPIRCVIPWAVRTIACHICPPDGK